MIAEKVIKFLLEINHLIITSIQEFSSLETILMQGLLFFSKVKFNKLGQIFKDKNALNIHKIDK